LCACLNRQQVIPRVQALPWLCTVPKQQGVCLHELKSVLAGCASCRLCQLEPSGLAGLSQHEGFDGEGPKKFCNNLRSSNPNTRTSLASRWVHMGIALVPRILKPLLDQGHRGKPKANDGLQMGYRHSMLRPHKLD
jgi:hypothetical protein